MLSATEEQKRMFYASGYSYNYVFHFPETELIFDNDQLHSEEMTLQESICDEEDLKLGGCIASSIEFVVSEIMAEEIAGLSFTAEIEVKDEDGLVVQVVPMGSFIVDAAEQMNDKDYKKVIAYDYMYEMSVDVSEWYNSFFADGVKHTVKETREALLEHLGASYVVQTLPNDDVLLEKTIEPNGNLTGTELLRSICEINGAFGRMNREGFFEEITLHGLGLYPEDALGEDGNLYPEETLYPEDDFEYLGQFDGSTICPQWRSTKYEEYMTQPITCLNIQSTAEDVGVTVGDDLSNPYVITANVLLYGKGSDELKTIGSSIFSQIRGLTYRPNTTELDGLPYLECGDVFALEKKNDSVESYIFSRTLKGIQALLDSFEAKGNKMRANEVTANEEIQKLKGKTLVIKKDIEGIRTEVSDLEESTSSRFEQTSTAIEMEVKRAENAEKALSSSINMTEEAITAEVKRATTAEKELSSSIQMTASTIVLQVDKDGKVAAITLDGSSEKTEFVISVENISLDGETIDLTADNISITSDKLNIGADGSIECAYFRQTYEIGNQTYEVIIENGNIECTGKIEVTQLDCNLADIEVFRVDGYTYHSQSASIEIAEALVYEIVFTSAYDIADKAVHVTNMDIDSQPNAYLIGVSVSGKQIRIRFANTVTGNLTFGITYWDIQP